MRKTGILWSLIPELEDTLQPHDSPWHLEADDTGNSIWAHINLVFENAVIETKDFDDVRKMRIRIAALFHDIAKPDCRGKKDGHSNFHHHDIVGAKMTEEILKRMKFPVRDIESISNMVRKHMHVHEIHRMKKIHKIRRLLGREDIDDLLVLGTCDTNATMNSEDVFMENKTIPAVEFWRDKFPVMMPERIIGGDDLLAEGFKGGENFKEALETAYDEQLNGVTDRNRLLKTAVRVLERKVNF
jgi:putative nucleotidyltransferase with HDIG domain